MQLKPLVRSPFHVLLLLVASVVRRCKLGHRSIPDSNHLKCHYGAVLGKHAVKMFVTWLVLIELDWFTSAFSNLKLAKCDSIVP